MPNYLPICLSIYLHICLSIYVSIYLSTYIYLTTCLLVNLSFYLPIPRVSLYLSVYLSILILCRLLLVYPTPAHREASVTFPGGELFFIGFIGLARRVLLPPPPPGRKGVGVSNDCVLCQAVDPTHPHPVTLPVTPYIPTNPIPPV